MLVAGAASLAHFWPRLADLDRPAGAEVAS
jgi:hypothetical protein